MNWPISLTLAMRLGRVSNLPTVWTNVLAGMVLAGGSVIEMISIPILIALSLFYIGGMFLNDAFDAEIDAVERPERPIPSGQIRRTRVFTLGFMLLSLGLVLLAWIGFGFANGTGIAPVLSGVVLAAMIIIYNAWHKHNPLSPLIMGLCRVLVYVTAGVCVTTSIPAVLWWGSGMLLCYLIGLTYVAKQENLARVKNLWPLVFLAAPLLYGLVLMLELARPDALLLGLFWLALAGWIGLALWYIQRRHSGDIPRAVVSLIAGIALLDALLIAAVAEPGLALLALLGFLLTLLLQRYVPGT